MDSKEIISELPEESFFYRKSDKIMVVIFSSVILVFILLLLPFFIIKIKSLNFFIFCFLLFIYIYATYMFLVRSIIKNINIILANKPAVIFSKEGIQLFGEDFAPLKSLGEIKIEDILQRGGNNISYRTRGLCLYFLNNKNITFFIDNISGAERIVKLATLYNDYCGKLNHKKYDEISPGKKRLGFLILVIVIIIFLTPTVFFIYSLFF